MYGSEDGDIISVDPTTGSMTTVIGGPTFDEAPQVAPDGSTFIFSRSTGAGDSWAVWVANLDGSGARMLVPAGAAPEYFRWAPGSDRLALVPKGGGDVAIVDVATGTTTSIDASDPILNLHWQSDDAVVLALAHADGSTGFSTARADGSALRPLPTLPSATYESSLSPDGAHLAYMTGGSTPETHLQIHVLDLATGKDTRSTPIDPGFEWEAPQFSPDGRWVKIDRFDATDRPLQLALLPVDQPGKPVLLGPAQAQTDDGVTATFSPDGTQLLARYVAARQTYVFDLASKAGAAVDWPHLGEFTSWQRLAP